MVLLCLEKLLSKLINSLPLPQSGENGRFFGRTPWRFGCILCGGEISSGSAFEIIVSGLLVLVGLLLIFWIAVGRAGGNVGEDQFSGDQNRPYMENVLQSRHLGSRDCLSVPG